LEIPLPLSGLNEALAHADQPPFTARVAENVRGRDGVTGRVRLASRAGSTRYVPDALGASKIARIAAAVYDSRRTTYAAQAVERVWGASLQGSRRATTGAIERQDNLHVLDGGHSLVKYNNDGAIVWTLKFPVADDKHVVNTVWVDDDGNVFAAVSSGGDPDTARVWRYRTKKINRQPDLVWTYTPGGYVTRLRSRGDLLVLAVEVPESETGKIVQLQGALSSGPTVGFSKTVSYPLPAFTLKPNGDILFTSPANPTRGIDPRYPTFTEKTVDAAIRDVLANSQKRLWCDLDAAKITGLANNDDVVLWEDQTGNGRDLFASGVDGETPPVYQADAINGRPAVHFRGGNTALGILDSLQSGINPSGDETNAEQQRTIIPAYKGAKWAMFMVVRPNLDPVGTTVRNMCLWSMDLETDGTAGISLGPEDLQMYVNRANDGLATTTGDASAGATRGAVSLITTPLDVLHEGASSGTSGTFINAPIQGYYDVTTGGNNTGTMLVTLVWDSGQDETVDDATVVHCTLRINGKPIDRWVGSKAVSPGPFWLGRSFTAGDAAAAYRFHGHVSRILVIRESDEAPNGLLTMPLYPRTVGTLGGAATSTAVAWDAASDTELEKIEGILMHEAGLSHLAPDGTTYTAPTLTAYGYSGGYDPGHYPHPYQRRYGPPTVSGEGESTEYLLASPTPILGKLDGSKGKLQWVVTSAAYAGDVSNGVGGLGRDVAVSGDRVFTIGDPVIYGTFPTGGYAGNVNHIRCVIDKNTSGTDGFSLVPADGAWAHNLGAGALGLDVAWDARCRIDADSFGNLYTPGAYTDSVVSAVVYQGARTNGIAQELDSVALFAPTYAAIVQRNVPAYRIGDGATDDFKLNPTSIGEQARAESFFLLGEASIGEASEVFQYRQVDAVTTSGSPRTITPLGFCGGSLFRFSQAGADEPAGTGTLTNPVYVGNYVSAVQAFQKVYFVDGRREYVYDPRADVVSYWRGTAAGKIPQRCRLIERWNGRLVLARAPDDPHGWHMSAQGDPLDWDFFPIPSRATMAVSGISAVAGAAPDMINGLISASDDLLIFLCESSVWMMRGDPAAGGQFDQVSEEVGGAFGRAWCRAPDGSIYFFSTKGAVYRMTGSGDAISVTRFSIDREMRDIDLETYYVELAWNEEMDGLHVLVMPYGAGGGEVRNWFMQRDPDGWFVDTFTDTDAQPTAVYDLHADDPDERGLLFGTQAGTIVKYDRDATADDGAAIAPSVVWGPFAPKGSRARWRFRHPTFVLDAERGGCGVDLYVNQDPTTADVSTWSGELVAGRNATLPMRGTGEYVWLGLSSRSSTESWAIEGASIEAVPVGRSHVRQ
jgi:hypothetical protein